MRRFLAVLRSFFLSSLLYTISFHTFPPISLPSFFTSSCHLFLGLLLNLIVSKFIYNNFVRFYFLPFSVHFIFFLSLYILFSSILYTFYFLPFSVHFIFFHSLYILFSSILYTFYFLPFSVHFIFFLSLYILFSSILRTIYFLPFSAHAQNKVIYLNLLFLLYWGFLNHCMNFFFG